MKDQGLTSFLHSRSDFDLQNLVLVISQNLKGNCYMIGILVLGCMCSTSWCDLCVLFHLGSHKVLIQREWSSKLL